MVTSGTDRYSFVSNDLTVHDHVRTLSVRRRECLSVGIARDDCVPAQLACALDQSAATCGKCPMVANNGNDRHLCEWPYGDSNRW